MAKRWWWNCWPWFFTMHLAGIAMSNTGSWSIWGAWLCLVVLAMNTLQACSMYKPVIVRWLPRLGLEKSKTFPIISWFILICDDSMIHVWWLFDIHNASEWLLMIHDVLWLFYDCMILILIQKYVLVHLSSSCIQGTLRTAGSCVLAASEPWSEAPWAGAGAP